jgi:excisionase family DNA binding protein
VKAYTTQEAAKLTGSSVRALRKRIERGQLRAVQHGRYWRIPHAELERLGLMGPEETARGQTTEGTNGNDPILAALERERAERRRIAQEVARLRPLTAHVERITEDLHRERAERQTAEAKLQELEQAHDAASVKLNQLATARFFARRRLLRDLRTTP